MCKSQEIKIDVFGKTFKVLTCKSQQIKIDLGLQHAWQASQTWRWSRWSSRTSWRSAACQPASIFQISRYRRCHWYRICCQNFVDNIDIEHINYILDLLPRCLLISLSSDCHHCWKLAPLRATWLETQNWRDMNYWKWTFEWMKVNFRMIEWENSNFKLLLDGEKDLDK